MKNRKIVVVAFLLAAVMLLGIGYATLTDTLYINGSMSADNSVSSSEFQNDIYFSAAVPGTVTDKEGNAANGSTAAHVTADNNKAYFEVVGMQEPGDKVTFKFTITNDSDWNALVTPGVGVVSNGDAGHNPIFDVVWSWSDTGVDQAAKDIAAHGGTLDVWVTVTLNTKPDAAHTATYEVTFTANSVGGVVETEAEGE